MNLHALREDCQAQIQTCVQEKTILKKTMLTLLGQISTMQGELQKVFAVLEKLPQHKQALGPTQHALNAAYQKQRDTLAILERSLIRLADTGKRNAEITLKILEKLA